MYNKKEVLTEIFDIENVYGSLKDCRVFTSDLLLEILCKQEFNLRDDLGVSYSTAAKWLLKAFPNKPKSNIRIDNWLLEQYFLKECKKCYNVYDLSTDNFHRNSGRSNGYNSYCKSCMNKEISATSVSRTAKYRAAKELRVPPWLSTIERSKITKMYLECPEGMQVDHIIPLRGRLVSGLHVLSNLQYLSTEDNREKSNKFQP